MVDDGRRGEVEVRNYSHYQLEEDKQTVVTLIDVMGLRSQGMTPWAELHHGVVLPLYHLSAWESRGEPVSCLS